MPTIRDPQFLLKLAALLQTYDPIELPDEVLQGIGLNVSIPADLLLANARRLTAGRELVDTELLGFYQDNTQGPVAQGATSDALNLRVGPTIEKTETRYFYGLDFSLLLSAPAAGDRCEVEWIVDTNFGRGAWPAAQANEAGVLANGLAWLDLDVGPVSFHRAILFPQPLRRLGANAASNQNSLYLHTRVINRRAAVGGLSVRRMTRAFHIPQP